MLDVLIVGAGPAGLTMAALLSKYNISFRIIDKKEEATKTSNALGVNARTLEMWRMLGLTERALALGLPVSEACYYFENTQTLFTFKNIQSEFPYNLFLPQATTEKLYIQYLEEKNIQIDRGCTLSKLTEMKDFVLAEIQTSAGDIEKIEAKWVVACDGYHSTVRELTAIPYVRDDLPQHFLMMDCQVKEPIQNMRLVVHKNGILIIFPMRDAIRVVAEVSHDPQWQSVKQNTADIMQSIIRERSPFEIAVQQVTWTSAFWVHEQIVDRYRQGRVFLLGDAAHAHSPAGGQGMNTGIQDAFNLAWKLAMVCQGKARKSLLDSYEIERRPIAKHVIRDSGRLLRIMTAPAKKWQWLRWFLFKFILPRSAFQKRMATHMTQLDIEYPPKQKRSIEFSSAGKFLLLISGQTENKEITRWFDQRFSGWVEVKQVASDSKDVSFKLIRPDMYIALETKKFAVIQTFLSKLSLQTAIGSGLAE